MFSGESRHFGKTKVLYTSYAANCLWEIQLNVVAFTCDRTKPYGEIEQPLGLAWVAPVEKEEMVNDYEGWGPQVEDILHVLSCLEREITADYYHSRTFQTHRNGHFMLCNQSSQLSFARTSCLLATQPTLCCLT